MDCNEVQSDGTMDCNKTPGRTKHLRWHSSMDIALLDTFLEAAKQGHRQGNTWHKNVWTRVCDAVFERTNRVVKKKHIECRLRTMRAEYKSFAELKERSGFTWDPVKQIITAPYEKWEELAKETGKYKSFRDRGPKWDFETLSIIVGNDHVSDDLPAVDKDLNSDDVGENANMDKVGKDANLYNVGEDDANVDNVGDDANLVNVGETLSVSTAGIGKRLLPSTHKRRNDKKRRFIRTVKGMIDGINVKIEQMAKPVDPMSFTKTLHSEVMKTKGLSMEYLDSAFAILRRDPIEAEIFLVRNMEFRKKMLEGLREKIGGL